MNSRLQGAVFILERLFALVDLLAGQLDHLYPARRIYFAGLVELFSRSLQNSNKEY